MKPKCNYVGRYLCTYSTYLYQSTIFKDMKAKFQSKEQRLTKLLRTTRRQTKEGDKVAKYALGCLKESRLESMFSGIEWGRLIRQWVEITSLRIHLMGSREATTCCASSAVQSLHRSIKRLLFHQ